MDNDRSADGAANAAETSCRTVGKVTIRLNSEVPGHVANRLQAALWREAIHLVMTGAADVEGLDKAVWAGPGLRWAAMESTMLFHLGDGGLRAFVHHFRDTFNGWWDDLGQPTLDDRVARTLLEGVVAEAPGSDPGRPRRTARRAHRRPAQGDHRPAVTRVARWLARRPGLP